MVQTNYKSKVFKIAAIITSLVLCLFCFSCGGDSNTDTYVVPTASIQLNSLDSWDGIDAFANDSLGDTSDSGVDIEKAYFTHDNEYFYVRIDIVGNVDLNLDNHLEAEISFFDKEHGYELTFAILLHMNSVDVARTDNSEYPCSFTPQMMSYPLDEFLEIFDHSIVFKIRLSDIDFNINGTHATVLMKSNTNEDSTNEKLVSMDTNYILSVTSDWPTHSTKSSYTVPNSVINIDGDLSDWNGIEPIFIDRIDDVYIKSRIPDNHDNPDARSISRASRLEIRTSAGKC